MPRNSTVASAPMMARVAAAFLACGRRKAWTPSATASTPVSAEAPDENARSIRNSVTVVTGSIGRLAVSATWHSDRHWKSPVKIVPATIATKPYVGQREERARLLHAAEVGRRDEHDEQGRDQDLVVREGRSRRGDRDRARRHRHRDGQHVVREDRRRGDQAGHRPQVLAGDDVGAAAAGVGANRLPVRRHDDREEGGDRERDGEPIRERRGPGQDEDEHHLLGGVRHRGEGVRGEDRQRERLGEELVFLGVDRQSPPEQEALQRAADMRTVGLGRHPSDATTRRPKLRRSTGSPRRVP